MGDRLPEDAVASITQLEVVSLLTLIRARDPAKREELGRSSESIAKAVRNYCLSRIGVALGDAERQEIAASVAHEIVIDLISDGNPRFEDAFWTMVHNKMRNAIRAGRRREKRHGNDSELAASAEEQEDPLHTEAQENRHVIVWETLASAPWNHTQAFVLHRILGYEIFSNNEDARTVCKILDCSKRTAIRWIQSVEKSLARELRGTST